jgi:Gram-negative bacterial TonB protein C-terminal
MPKLEHKIMPVYPNAAKQQHIWGDLVLDVTLKDDGTAERVDVVEGPPQLVGSSDERRQAVALPAVEHEKQTK